MEDIDDMSGEVSGVMRGEGPKEAAAAAAKVLFKAAI